MRETLGEYELDAETLGVGELRRYLNTVWEELRTPAGRESLKRQGLPEDIAGQKFEEFFFVEPSGAALVDPVSVLIGMLITGAGTVGKDLWKKVLLPRIEERYGKKALKARKTTEKKAGDELK
ncbi:hypothetical protein [Paucibacter sp. KCTC 42545]|uniref:hypothetical protein n=1 Tax=Paucibacter sp. KCTC 42545 TaxID=1768242 RepID=UPI0012E3C955|nr:hypothetical protein [Paucibacter sp. KCTC 42545]